MSDAETSPLPWHDDDGFIKDATGKIVDMRAVNRLLIIPAVNTHDRLFAAAKEVMDLSIHIDAPRLRAAFIHLQAAIAAAEE